MRASFRAFVVALALLSLSVTTPAQQPQQPAAQQPPAGQPPAQQPPAGQQPPPPQQPRPQFKTGINFVTVDVIVTDKKTGNVVLDLKPEDFQIAEDNKPQKVEAFDVVKIDNLTQATETLTAPEIHSTEDEEREARRTDTRLFVMLLDDYHVRRGNDLFVRRPLIDFVQNQLGPNDMVAIMYPLTSVSDLSFTRNKDSLIKAIEKFEGRKARYDPQNEFEERYAYYPTVTVENIRNDVTMGALKGAAVRLGGLREGRKSIIFVSEGFTSYVPPQLNNQSAALPGVGNRAQPGQDPASNPRADAQKFFDSADLLGRLKEVFDTANRNNTSIYAVDPRGLAAFEHDINEGVSLASDRGALTESLDTLHILADNTDGRAIVNRNDLAAGMKQIIRDSSGYYLLGYTSAAAPTDGRFHKIDVKVKRPGVEVRARKGYWAYTTEDVARATAPPKPGPPPAVRDALNAIAEPARGRSARFWIGTDRADSGKTRVMFVWEPIPAGPGDRRDPADTPSRVMLTATAADGRPLFRGRVPDTSAGQDISAPPPPAGTAATAPTSSGPISATFEAPPGQLQLRMTVEGARGQVVDSTTRELTVPDFTTTTVSFGTPRFYRARTPRELQEIKTHDTAVPTPDRAFSRTERILLRVNAYAPGGTTPQVTATLLNRAGQSMSDVPVQPAGDGRVQIDLPLAPLAAGEYLLQLDAKTDKGSAQEVLAFKVGG